VTVAIVDSLQVVNINHEDGMRPGYVPQCFDFGNDRSMVQHACEHVAPGSGEGFVAGDCEGRFALLQPPDENSKEQDEAEADGGTQGKQAACHEVKLNPHVNEHDDAQRGNRHK
jgi:hypothetical protein